jgi:release factor glutamine methyltransferase
MQQLKQNFLARLSDVYPEKEISSLFFQSVQKVTGCSKSVLLANPAFSFSGEQEKRLDAILTRLQAMEPIQYILGECEFYSLSFCVNPSVLIPRPETEELVEWIISDYSGQSGNLLDIGTGSGCIAVATGKFLKSFSISAIDLSEAALAVAKENAETHHCRVQFMQADILKADDIDFDDDFDVIVSNPPYVCEWEKQRMSQNVVGYEPHLALFVPNDDPLVFHKAIALFGKKWLKGEGKLYLEINEGLGEECVTLLAALGYRDIMLRKDIFGRERMVRAVRPRRDAARHVSTERHQTTDKNNYISKMINYQEALSKATKLCSLSEKCEQDIREKLVEWQLSIENIEKIIAYLKKEKYLDEMRFARFFAEDKHRFSKWGKSKIIFMLKNKGISSETINEAVKNIDSENYSEQLKSLLTSKLKSIKYKNLYDAKAKLYRFGMSRGFENELVLKTIDEILQ